LTVLLLALPFAVNAVPASTGAFQSSATHGFAPLHANAEEPIPNSYIVAFKHDLTPEAMALHTSFIQTAHLQNNSPHDGINHVYMETLKGYSGSFDERTLNAIRASPEVDYVEVDQKVYASEIQKGAPWGLARISHRERLGFSTFQSYVYDKRGGEGVDVYVIDTGINIKHVEFEGRARWGKTMPKNDVDEDGNGHGTHCAGTIASRAYGVAKGANVIAVKVLGSNGSGTMSDVIGGVDFAASSAKEKWQKVRAEELRTGKKSSFKGSVANLSLGGGKVRSLDDAINRAVAGGLHIAVAAGNDNKDACNYSPAAAESAVTVGASTLQDGRAYFSNWGNCVDVFGPGLNIKSTWNSGPRSTNTISGTSMASPHVAGLLAYLLSIFPDPNFNPSIASLDLPAPLTAVSSNPTMKTILSIARYIMPSYFAAEVVEETESVAPIPTTISPAQLKKALIKLSSPDKLTDVGQGSPNLLVFNNATLLQSKDFWAPL
jgi:cerevisin